MFKRDGLTSGFDSKPINHQLEALEPRVLLTTLVGGDVFEYIDAQGQTVRVALQGDAIIELIGADINNSNNALILGDLPGYIYKSDLGRTGAVAGGLGGADGVEQIGVIKLTDPINGSGGSLSGPNDTLDIRALATHPTTGNTWAMQIVTLTRPGEDSAVTVAQLIEFNADSGVGTVRGSFQLVGNIVNSVDVSPITDIVAAAFDIRPGQQNTLYFVTEMGGTGGAELRSVNVATNTLDGRRRVLVNAAENTAGHRVTGIDFDKTGAGGSNYDLVVATLRSTTIDGQVVPINYIERSTVVDDFFSGSKSSVKVQFKGEPVVDITGIAFKGDDAAAAERYVYATTPEGLLLVDLNTGFAQFMGQLADPDDTRAAQRGSDLQDITWDANSVNPFTGETGVLVAVDATTDDLVYVDDRPRFATADIFAIYVSQSSENAQLSIAVVPPFDPDFPDAIRTMQPFDGNVGIVRVKDLSGLGERGSILISPTASTGGVWIGARTEELSDLILDEEAVPVVTAFLSEALGVRAAGNISSGIHVAPSGLEYAVSSGSLADRLLGSNLDRITALAANRFGDIAAVDTDRVNSAGTSINGDQLFFIDGSTGKADAASIKTIHDGGGNLVNTAAIAYGFADLTQINDSTDEELYAIIDNRFGTLDSDGLFTQITADLTTISPAVLGANATIRSMTFAPGGSANKQTLYIIADPNGTDATDQSALYEVIYNVNPGTGVISVITGINRIGAVNNNNINAMTFDSASRLLAQDRTNGQVVQILLEDLDIILPGNIPGVLPAGSIYPLPAESPEGSLRSTVGGMTYDLASDRILVVDNATSLQVLANEAGSNHESAALMVFRTDSSTQNFGSILIGGAVTGEVYISGSVDTFYAGWIITGATAGQGIADPVSTNNFYVGGDIRNLVTLEDIGTNDIGTPEVKRAYNSGVDINVQGRLGQIKGNEAGIFRLNVGGVDTEAGLSAQKMAQGEVEYRAKPTGDGAADGPGVAFEKFHLFNGSVFSNDTIAQAQILGTMASNVQGEEDVIRVSGALVSAGVSEDGSGDAADNAAASDTVDYYAVALIAGQTIVISIEETSDNFLPLTVYNPDGSLIATESDTANNTITITADRPGLYTIGVNKGLGTATDGEIPYNLRIDGAGRLTAGGIDLNSDYYYAGTSEALVVASGDFGAARVANLTFSGGEKTFYNDVNVAGNLRAIMATQIGGGGLSQSGGLNAIVGGDVGLISASAGSLAMPSSYIGGNIQMITASEAVTLNLYVDGGIGNIHAGSMPTTLVDGIYDQSFIRVNNDGVGDDGIIDLIDIRDDMGSTLYGGPAIITGASGNVRYIRVGGTVYQDSFFAAGTAGPIVGNIINVIDDSGARVRMEATRNGELSVETYGIRGSGGSVIVRVETTTGLIASSTTGQNKRPAEISEIIVPTTGNKMDIDLEKQKYTITKEEGSIPVTIAITGSNLLDVFSIVGHTLGTTFQVAGQVDSITNSTGGELVNLALNSVGLLNIAGSIGTAKSSNDTAVLARELKNDIDIYAFSSFPFSIYRNLIAAGDFGDIISNSSIGNVSSRVLTGVAPAETIGAIGSLRANNDNKDNPDVFEGIVGPIYADSDIFKINIGEGLAAEGTGFDPIAGIYSEGAIGTISNQGLGSDIRGTISSLLGIDQIILTGGGAIIDARILAGVDAAQASPINHTYTVVDGSYINKIKLSGNGGIIGTYMLANIIGEVTVSGGFGILNSGISTTTTGSIGKVRADGFGIRNVSIGDGNNVGEIVATQRCDKDLDVSSYTPSVRPFEFAPGTATANNDLLTALYTSTASRDYLFKAGVISFVTATGTVSLGDVEGFRIENSTFNFANAIDSVKADENFQSSSLTTGVLKNISVGSSKLRGDIIDSTVTVAGNIGNITVYGNIDNSNITTNNNGTLNRLIIKKATDSDKTTFAYDDITENSFYKQVRDTLSKAGVLLSDLQGLAVRGSDHAVFAARYNTVTHQDELLQIDPIKGTITVLGPLADVHYDFDVNADVVTEFGTSTGSQIQALAFKGNDLYAITSDSYGANGGTATPGSDVSLYRITLTPFTDGRIYADYVTELNVQGPVVSAMAFDNTGRLFLVLDGDIVAELSYKDLGDPDYGDYVSAAGFGGLNLIGIGFDDTGTMRGVDSISDQLYALDIDTSGLTVIGDAPDGLTAFAIGNVGGGFINGSLLSVAGRVNTIDIEGNIYNSTIRVLSGSAGKYSVGTFNLGGSLSGTGDLEFYDDVNKISVAGSLGIAGGRLVIGGDLKTLTVGSDKKIMGVEMGLDLVVLGDLGTFTVNGVLSGNVTVRGSLSKLTVTADDTQAGTNILTGDINVTEGIKTISVRDGNVSGNIFAGRDLSSFSIKDGNFTSTASATSTYGDIRSFSVSGDMDGLVQADNGEIRSLKVSGDMGATAQILAQSARTLSISGQIVGGASIEIDRVINSLTAGYIGDGATAVNITAGGVNSLSTRGVRNINDGDLYANLTVGDSGKATKITTKGNFGGTAMIQGDASLNVRGDMDMDVTNGEYFLVNGNVSSLKVSGDLSGGVFVQGEGRSWSANSITNAIITTGFDLRSLSVREAVTGSIIQTGIWAGNDQTFATIDGQQDLGEQSRRATLGKFTADSVDNSIVAAGGDLTSVSVKNAVNDSSFSSGWSVGSLAISERMGGELDGDVLREQAGRALFNGSIKSFRASDIIGSYVTAGVDAGVGGDFSAATVIYDNGNGIRSLVDGGGMSEIGTIRGTTDVNSRLVADSGISRNSTDGLATIDDNVTYSLADLEQGNALAASVGIATQATPLVYTDSGVTVTITITVKGNGSVDARDITLADGVLDGLVISGTNSKTTIDIKTSTPGAVDIGRIFTADDTQLRSFTFDGGIVGDDTAGLDVWFDGEINSLDLAGFGNAASTDRVTGAIGGDVRTFDLGNQTSGTLRISGEVRTLNVINGSGDPLQINRQQYAGRDFTSLSIDGGNVYAVEGNNIYTIDPLNNNNISSVAVTDATLGTSLNIVGMDIENATGNVFAVAKLYNQNPTVAISAMDVELQGLAVRDTDGALFAIRYDSVNHVDKLVRIDAATGGLTTIGILQDVFGNSYGTSAASQVLSLAFNSNNTLYAILTDRDAANAGAASGANDIAIAAIATTANAQGFVRVTNPSGNQALPAKLLTTNGGESYSGLTVDGSGNVFAIRNNNIIVQINTATGADIATHTFGGVTLTGIGFDNAGNLIGLDIITNKLYELDLGTDTANALSNTTLAPGLNAFAIGKHGTNGYTTYAYDDTDDVGIAGDERALYTNAGLVSTLGLVDPVTGLFTQLRPLVQDATGNPLEGNVISVAVDSANTRIKVLTDAGQLVTYNNDGTLDSGTAIIDLVDSNGNAVTTVSKIDYSADGRLLGVDQLGKQIVVIEPDTGLVSHLTEPGSVQGDNDAFTIDEVTGIGLLFNNTTDQVTSLAGFTQDALGGISASSINRLNIGEGFVLNEAYAGRIFTQGELRTIVIDGNYAGVISAGGEIRSLKMGDGEFSGIVSAQGDIRRADLRDADFTEDGVIWSERELSLDVRDGKTFDGLFNGKVVAGELKKLTSKTDMASNATIIATNDAGTLSFDADFSGSMNLAQLSRSLTIDGVFLTPGSINIQGDAATINLKGGSNAGTMIDVDGAVRTLKVGGVYSGILNIKNGLQSGSFDEIFGALITIGLDTRDFNVRDNVTSSLLSFGVWAGQDNVYNSFDDVITGGEVRKVTINGNYRDSITAVGVLPSYNQTNVYPTVSNNYMYLGNAAMDSAEAGGLLYSVIESFSIRGEISSTNVNAGRFSGLVAADELKKVSLGQTGNILQQRVYSDAYGPVQLVTVNQLSSNLVEIILSEPVQSASVVFSIDRNGDNVIQANAGDQQGSITLLDASLNIINNVQANVSTRMISGTLRGVITVVSPVAIPNLAQNYGNQLLINVGPTTLETFSENPVLMDRSGLRSALRSFNGDPLGTLFDSNNDGFEG